MKKKIETKGRLNWHPISLLNVGTKIILRALSEKLKVVLSSLILTQQTEYIKNRFTGEGGRLIPDIINTFDHNSLSGYSVAMNIEKEFDSLDHKFILAVLKNVDLVKTLSTGVSYY